MNEEIKQKETLKMLNDYEDIIEIQHILNGLIKTYKEVRDGK